MAYTNFTNCTEQEYLDIIYSQDDKNRIRIWFNNVELQDADEYCESLTGTNRIIPEDGSKRFSLSNFIAKEYNLVLRDLPAGTTIEDQVKVSIGTLVDENTYEDVPIGIFNIQDTPTTDKNKTTIKLRDNRVKFDFGYNAKPLIDSQGGTASLKEILDDICLQAGVTNDVLTFAGDNIEVSIYDSTIKASAYVSYIAEQAGAVPVITREGHLAFIYLNNVKIWRIPLSIVEKYEIGTPFEVERVVYESGIIKYETSSDNTLETLYLDAANPYITSQTQVNTVFTIMNGFTIDSVEIGKMLGNPAIDPYDLIEIYDDENINEPTILKTLANNTYKYNGVHRHTFETTIGQEERKENVTINNNETFKKVVKTEIDNINGELALKVEEDGVIAAINLSSESATINANKISLAGKNINLTADNTTISSTNFSVDSNGNLTSKSGDIGGFHIGQDSLWNSVEEYATWQSASGKTYKYNMDDAYGAGTYSVTYGPSGDAPQEFLEKYGFSTTAELIDKWDATLDGQVRINDVMKIASFVLRSYASNISLNAGQSGSPANITLGGVKSTESVKITSLGEIILKDDYAEGLMRTKSVTLNPTGGIALTGQDLHLGATPNTDDSGDIVFRYGDDSEKARIWTDNTYSVGAGPQYRVYDPSGNQLYSGRLGLENDYTATIERIVGVWKGLPLYRRIYEGYLNSSGTLDNDISVDGTIQRIEGYVYSIYANWWVIGSHYFPEPRYDSCFTIPQSSASFNIKTNGYFNQNSKYVVIVEYTK